MLEGKVRTVSVHSVWWRARYVKLVYTQCGKGGGGGVGGGGGMQPTKALVWNKAIYCTI